MLFLSSVEYKSKMLYKDISKKIAFLHHGVYKIKNNVI